MTKPINDALTSPFATDDRELTIFLPNNWEFIEPPNDMLMVAMAPENEASEFDPQITLSQEHLTQPTSSKDYFLANFIPLKASLEKFEERESGTHNINGGQIAWLSYAYQIEGVSAVSMDYFIVSKSLGFVLHCCCPKSEESTWKQCFRTVGASLVIGA